MANDCIADSRREIKIAPKLKTVKEQGVTLVSYSGPLQTKGPKGTPPPIVAVVLPRFVLTGTGKLYHYPSWIVDFASSNRRKLSNEFAQLYLRRPRYACLYLQRTPPSFLLGLIVTACDVHGCLHAQPFTSILSSVRTLFKSVWSIRNNDVAQVFIMSNKLSTK